MNELEARAIREMKARNPLRNDHDAYLFHLAEWVLGETDDRPEPEDFGLVPLAEFNGNGSDTNANPN